MGLLLTALNPVLGAPGQGLATPGAERSGSGPPLHKGSCTWPAGCTLTQTRLCCKGARGTTAHASRQPGPSLLPCPGRARVLCWVPALRTSASGARVSGLARPWLTLRGFPASAGAGQAGGSKTHLPASPNPSVRGTAALHCCYSRLRGAISLCIRAGVAVPHRHGPTAESLRSHLPRAAPRAGPTDTQHQCPPAGHQTHHTGLGGRRRELQTGPSPFGRKCRVCPHRDPAPAAQESWGRAARMRRVRRGCPRRRLRGLGRSGGKREAGGGTGEGFAT